jgi:hypothetical protein
MKGHPMKNKIVSIIILMALTLAACSTASTANQSTTTTNTRSFAGQAELIVGIFKLEGTDQAVTVKQASELLPLWEVMKVLANSSTSAQAEIDATVLQIKNALTPNQLQAIKAMNLTEQDVSVFEQSLNTNTVQTSSKSSSSGQSGGGFGPGGDSLGGVLTGTSQVKSSATSTTPVKASSGTSSQVPIELIDALIKLLEKRANA